MSWHLWPELRVKWLGVLTCGAGLASCAQIAGLNGDYHEAVSAGAGGTAQGGNDAGKGGLSSAGAHSGGASGNAPEAGSAGDEGLGGNESAGAGSGGLSANGGKSSSGGTGGAAIAGGGNGASGAAGAPATNYGGVVGLEDLSTVKPSGGCAKDVTTFYPGITFGVWQPTDNHDYLSGFTIPVMTPAGHPVTAIAGVIQRRYFLRLPPNYDKNKPYRLLYEAGACTSHGTEVADFSTTTNGQAIIVGLELYPAANTNNGVACFDDHRGALSADAPYIEALHARLKSQLCIDEHRVFVSGHNSGSWLTNQFGNSYGSVIFRAIAPSSGGLAQGAQQQPTNNLPVPGIWWHQPADGTNPISGTKAAINHALVVNKCTGDYDTSPQSPAIYPNVTVCQKFSNCPPEFPITICTPPGTDHSNNFDKPEQRAATWTFLSAF